ncbi:MAG: redox-sensing transcriptional repressor Rex [Clostridia bacterium]|nr:redox-sensing transcriptional repressor Rex [Clostridia bacterium]
MADRISPAIIKRLPRYYRVISHLDSEGTAKVSSSAIAQMMDITASQVRQDFCNFGGFGQQGYGYDVSKLKSELESILGLDRRHNMIIIGAGNIGRAISGYKGFGDGFCVSAVFDVKTDGLVLPDGIGVYSMDKLDQYCKGNKVDIAVIATPGQAAQSVADAVVAAGVKNIWNFAPTELSVADGVVVENISMSESLYVLCYYMNNKA